MVSLFFYTNHPVVSCLGHTVHVTVTIPLCSAPSLLRMVVLGMWGFYPTWSVPHPVLVPRSRFDFPILSSTYNLL